jgi:EpsI family protein
MDRKKTIVGILAVTLVLAAAAGNYLRFSTPPSASALGLDGYRLVDETGRAGPFEVEPIDEEFLDLLGAREVSFRTYEEGTGHRVWVFMGYFDRQKEGSQVHSPKHCYPGSGWNILEEDNVPAPWGDGRVKRLIVSDGAQDRLVYYWFQTSSRVLKDVFALKYYLTRQAMLRHPQDLVFVRISSGTADGVQEAEMVVQEYARRVQVAVSDLYNSRAQP